MYIYIYRKRERERERERERDLKKKSGSQLYGFWNFFELLHDLRNSYYNHFDKE